MCVGMYFYLISRTKFLFDCVVCVSGREGGFSASKEESKTRERDRERERDRVCVCVCVRVCVCA